jgi:hypothetical protein
MGDAAGRVFRSRDLMSNIVRFAGAGTRTVAQVSRTSRYAVDDAMKEWMKTRAMQLATAVENFWDSVVEVFRLVFWDKRYDFSSALRTNSDGVSTLDLLMCRGTIRLASITAWLLDGVCPGFKICIYFMTAHDLNEMWDDSTQVGQSLRVEREVLVDMDSHSLVPDLANPTVFQWPDCVRFKTRTDDTWAYFRDMCYDRNVFKKTMVPYFMLVSDDPNDLYAHSKIARYFEDDTRENPTNYTVQPTRRQRMQDDMKFEVQVMHSARTRSI